MKKIISLIIFCLLIAVTVAAEGCVETIVIDSVEYNVTERWAGKKIDSAQIAEPEKLVRLPDSLTFEDYKIYVRTETKAAFVEMADAAQKDSIYLIVDSGYRSGSFQNRIIKRRMAEGTTFEEVIRFVAPPGYSEHETGYAVDLVPSEARFAHTKIYLWLIENGSNYGFYETIPEDTTGETYWESWHWTFSPTE